MRVKLMDAMMICRRFADKGAWVFWAVATHQAQRDATREKGCGMMRSLRRTQFERTPDVNLEPVDPQVAAMIVVVGVQFLIGIVASAATIYGNMKRKPALDQEVYKDFARLTDLDKLREQQTAERAHFLHQVSELDQRHQRTAGEIFNVLRQLKDDIGKQSRHVETSLNGVAKALGGVEGRLQGHIESEAERMKRMGQR